MIVSEVSFLLVKLPLRSWSLLANYIVSSPLKICGLRPPSHPLFIYPSGVSVPITLCRNGGMTRHPEVGVLGPVTCGLIR
jgi:hypothetical protein